MGSALGRRSGLLRRLRGLDGGTSSECSSPLAFHSLGPAGTRHKALGMLNPGWDAVIRGFGRVVVDRLVVWLAGWAKSASRLAGTGMVGSPGRGSLVYVESTGLRTPGEL